MECRHVDYTKISYLGRLYLLEKKLASHSSFPDSLISEADAARIDNSRIMCDGMFMGCTCVCVGVVCVYGWVWFLLTFSFFVEIAGPLLCSFLFIVCLFFVLYFSHLIFLSLSPPLLSPLSPLFPSLCPTVSPVELARQLTLLEYEMYHCIQAKECLDQNWNKKGKETKSPNILNLIHQFNKVQNIFFDTVIR